jgi:hypothetical protein
MRLRFGVTASIDVLDEPHADNFDHPWSPASPSVTIWSSPAAVIMGVPS